MKICYDEKKSLRNIVLRQLAFSRVEEFDWETAVIIQDRRFDYSEIRYTASGFVGERLHIVCYTPILGGIRVISFRKANKREIKKYEQARSETTHK